MHDDEMLTTDGACKLLGVSQNKLRRLVLAGKVHVYRDVLDARRLLFRRRELEELLQRRHERVEPPGEA